MQHRITASDHGARGEEMARAVEACVHCGFCLPTCPTYNVLEEEMDSPRGRIFLMKEALEGNVPFHEVVDYIDRCLGCVACETSCPSGVPYGELVTPFRAYSESYRRRSFSDRLLRWMVLQTLPFPNRFRWAVFFGRLGKLVRGVMPGRVRTMISLLPSRLTALEELPEIYPAVGARRARVALLAGCAQRVLAPEINWATLRVLARNGVEVIVPRGQGCCGALSLHTGADEQAAQLAARNVQAFPNDVDAVITNAAGCGSGMKEYPLLFRGTAQETEAREFSERVQDVSAFLDALGPIVPPPLKTPLKLAYHDACHLGHAQRVREAPRRLLSTIEGLSVETPRDWELCCGSAGTYNVEQPEIAAELGKRKARTLLEVAPDLIATGNIGCITQLRAHLDDRAKVCHTIEVLDWAYRQVQMTS